MLEPGQQLLLNSLQKLVSDSHDLQASLQATIILVNTGNASDLCTNKLKYILQKGNQTQKVQVSDFPTSILEYCFTQALDYLMNSLNCTDAEVIESAFKLLLEMRDWRVSTTHQTRLHFYYQ